MGFANLDLLTVGAAVAALSVIGVVALLANNDRRLGRYFAFFCFVNAAWGTVNYVSYQIHDPYLALISLRLILFAAVFQTMSFSAFIMAFGSERLPRWFARGAVPIGVVIAISTLTPLYFKGIQLGGRDVAPQPIVSPLIGIFAVVAILFVLTGLFSLFRQLRAASGERREQLTQILTGTTLMFCLIIFLNFLAPVLLNTTFFVPLGAIFVLPFAIMTGYAILNQHLFNVKVAATGVLVFLLSLVSFADIVFSNTLLEILLRIGVFILVLVFGINLIRGVLREIEQREHIEMLAKDLETANAQQVTLIHFISHQLKGFIGKARGIFSLLQEGDFGPLPEAMKPIIDEGFASATKGAQTIQDILNASNIKSGKMAYTMMPFDFKALVDSIVATQKPSAEAKNVTLTLTEPNDPIMLTGDQMQMENAIKNLVDNTIKYTPHGSIKVTLANDGTTVTFKTEDTGVGITPEDMQHLFTEGGHGAESHKVNVDSTGFGLYIVKNIIEAHGGRVWAESAGAGKGSTFIVQLPVSVQNAGNGTR